MTLAHVTFEVDGLVVSARTENVWAFERVLRFVTQFVRNQLLLTPEFLRTYGTGQVGMGHAIEVIFTVLRKIGCDGDIVPVESDPFLQFWKSHVFLRIVGV